MRGTRLELRSESLRHNARRARQLSGEARLFAMVKANGYGHGLVFVARALRDDVDGFGVALLDEARALRQADIAKPIMLLEGPFDADELEEAARLKCELVVHSEWQLVLLERFISSFPIRVWLKVDTGMHRLGLPLAEAENSLRRLRQCPAITLAGVMSHFACADMVDDALGDVQLGRLTRLAAHEGVPFSAANSAALFRFADSTGELVRPGIMLYGSSPFLERRTDELGLKVTQRLSARIIAINDVPVGDSVGYGASWRATRRSRIAVVAIGYGDGYPRHAPSGTPVAVKDADNTWRQAALVGRVSMDMITIDITDLSTVKIGDEVELWGDVVSIDEVAHHCGTISYELFCRLTSRPERVES